MYVTHKGWVGGDTPSATGGSVYLALLLRRLEPADILETRFSSGAHSALVSERTPRAVLSVRVKDKAGHAVGQHVRRSYIAQL